MDLSDKEKQDYRSWISGADENDIFALLHDNARLEQYAESLRPLYAFPAESWGALLAPDILPDYGEWDIWMAVHDLLRSIADTVNIQEATMPIANWQEALEMLREQFDHENALPLYDLIEARILELETSANKLQCLQEAGIDNVEAYSIGMQLYYKRYEPEEEDEWVDPAEERWHDDDRV